MIQVLRELTRKGALLDLLFEHRDGLVGEAMTGGCLGHSDQKTVEFKIFGDMGKTGRRATPLDSGRADFRLLEELVSKVPWESAFEGTLVHKCWSLFKSHFLRVQERAIPACRTSGKRDRRLAWLTRNLLWELRWRTEVYGLWKGIWGSWLMVSSTGVNDVPRRPKGPAVSWGALGAV